MVIGLLAVAAIPTVTGVGQAVSAQKKQNAAAKSQAKFHLTAVTKAESSKGEGELGICVLERGQLFIIEGSSSIGGASTAQTTTAGGGSDGGGGGGHRFCGHYFTYPCPEQHQGLVSTISDAPPALHWIYVDAQTGLVRHGGRRDTLGHVIGPWGWTDDDDGDDEGWLTLHGGAGGFVARCDGEDEMRGGRQANRPRRWAIYWEGGGAGGAASGEGGKQGDDDEGYGDGDQDQDERQQECSVWLRRRPLLGIASRYVRD